MYFLEKSQKNVYFRHYEQKNEIKKKTTNRLNRFVYDSTLKIPLKSESNFNVHAVLKKYLKKLRKMFFVHHKRKNEK